MGDFELGDNSHAIMTQPDGQPAVTRFRTFSDGDAVDNDGTLAHHFATYASLAPNGPGGTVADGVNDARDWTRIDGIHVAAGKVTDRTFAWDSDLPVT